MKQKPEGQGIIEAAGMSADIIACTDIKYEPPGQMKASELIAHLQAAIQAHGDVVVGMEYDGVLSRIACVERITDFAFGYQERESAARGFPLPFVVIMGPE